MVRVNENVDAIALAHGETDAKRQLQLDLEARNPEAHREAVVVRDGRYRVPKRPGYSAEIRPESLARYAFR